MIKWSLAIILLALLIFSLAELPEYSPSYDLWVRGVFDRGFYRVFSDSLLGEIYHSNTFHALEDSLVEYYWKGNYVLVGENKISKANQDRYNNYMQTDRMGIIKTISLFRLSNEEGSAEDSMIIIRDKPVNDYNLITTISINNDNRILMIYGKNYSVEDSYRLGSFLYFGMVRESIKENVPVNSPLPDHTPEFLKFDVPDEII
jgi:hypothetical protein